MATCKQCGKEFEAKRQDARYCSSQCRLRSHRETDNSRNETDNSVAVCQQRAREKLPWRPGDPVWPYTRHLTPIESAIWSSINKPSWLLLVKPGDADYTDGPGRCRTCGAETQCEAIIRCYQCVHGKAGAA